MIKITAQDTVFYGTTFSEETGHFVLDGTVYPLSVIGPYTVGEGEPPAAPEPVPLSVSPRQFRQQLDIGDLYDTVQTAVAAADNQTKIWWEYATEIDRNNAPLNAMAAALGVTTEQLDGLFIEAAKL